VQSSRKGFRGLLSLGHIWGVLSPISLKRTKRPLQGQSDNVVNAILGYDNPDIGTSVALLYNVFGERIAYVGSHGLPDIYQQPFNQLDFVVSQVVWDGLSFKFKAKNLINEDVRLTQGDQPYELFKLGREFSLSATWRF